MADRSLRFARAQTAVARALSGDPRLKVTLDATPPADAPREALDAVRGLADLEALKRRHHGHAAHARHAPSAAAARAVYDWAEEARLSALAGRSLLGVTRNLDAALEQRCREAAPETAAADVDTPLALAAGLWLREQLTGRSLPPTAARIVGCRRTRISAALTPLVPTLNRLLHQQDAFAATAARLPAALGMPVGDNPETPLPRDDAPGDEDDDTGTAMPAAGSPNPADAADQETASGDRAESTASNGPALAAPETEDTGSPDPNGIGVREAPTERPGTYRVYTRAFDRITRAGDALERARLEQLSTRLRQGDAEEHTTIMRLARRLERALMSEQRRRWVFDQDAGLLDATRLASVVADPTLRLPFKREITTPFPDTVLTLLLDCSGSMRGRPIRLAGLCAMAVGEALARCAIKVEVLGFTTRAWDGGASGAAWERAGQPAAPGRLNDLHHIIFKEADAPWRRSRRNLGLLLQDDLLKENIDGEALQWAHQRLLRRREARRVLLVISDGLPRDGLTRRANPTGFLEAHLRHVIDHIEGHSPVELAAIGIGHDVTAYYRNAVAIPAADRLGAAMTGQLLALFTGRRPSAQEQ
ncbi:cobaltochelatase CobT-related protein [Aquisalimonas asiatica]|uniref:Cobaltochelatase CobT subunit n=1 Tax=Aquisalimonas asiatica TaxID=406100 RepID=A0A1H8SUJ9_9GAMM|nr:hypothetical protein [Aquisalimonas asiatica]SEO82649.1 cobaltochelatase CobT subunit [Aquisalimonas asiatica]